MRVFDEITPDNLERREIHLGILTCSAIAILGIGMALLMYPAAFSSQASPDYFLRVVFSGFCALCFLFAVYVWDRHRMILRLRRQLDQSRRLTAHVQTQASVELLSALPNFKLFQDYLPMELRRTVATLNELSVLVVNLKLAANVTPGEGMGLFSGAAKVLYRKLRQRDSIYVLTPTCFGIVLPNIDMASAERISHLIAQGLTDAAGTGNRFSYGISIVNYPVHASSASELLQVVQKLMPEDKFDR
jgi:GGDEF domain-containing protein